MARGKKRVTIVDIAKLCGVSAKTVSRVLNGEPHVTDKIRDQVLATAKELKYQPNVVAQGLVSRRSYLIGLIYEKPSPSYVVDLQKGALERLHGERYRLIVLPVESVASDSEAVVKLLQATAVDGVLLAPPASDDSLILTELDELHIPFARISPTRLPEFGPSVAIDDIAAASEIAEHLIGLGHRRIGIIKGDATHAATEARLLGYAQAMARHGIPLNLDFVESGLFSFESGHDAALRLLKRPVRPTAILAQNDDMAAGAIAAARSLGIEVPRDLSVAGFDDSDIARVVWPALTTVRQPVEAMAHQAMDMLLAMLAGDVPGPSAVHGHILQLRQSTAAPAST
ncbi:LacI family DNA-binding transcriptional regulator [Novosphingobium sp.]|uniref:LacI family DNA-binding transcriptional regulator n=1 Tax=Novosphingobium sp. TaxID=1874826 RepID=UPI0026123A9B|nr:LacI family DNA-binding transcriptional regulator [Novosphingobium sp.]